MSLTARILDLSPFSVGSSAVFQGETALLTAANYNHLDTAKALVENKANVDTPAPVIGSAGCCYPDDMVAVLCAEWAHSLVADGVTGAPEMTQFLLTSKANPN